MTYILLFLLSFGLCGLLVVTRNKHLRFSARDHDHQTTQSAHKVPTPRIGGIGLGVTIAAALLFATPDPLRFQMTLFAVSLFPVFVAGLAEDLGFDVKPSTRLLAAVISSFVAIAFLQMWVPRFDIPGLDVLIAIAPIGIVFTAIATAGVSNAFNLIDGVNGLSALTGVAVTLGLSFIARQAGDPQLAQAILYILPALLGFLVFNYPFGKIFLGDAGAYILGHVLAWLAVILMVRVETVSPWAIILVFFWPISDTVFAIYRRKRSGRPTDQPDRLHFHQLVMRAIELCGIGRDSRQVSNPLTTFVLLPFLSAPVVAGVVLWNKPGLAAFAVGVFATFMLASYVLGVRIARRRPQFLRTLLLRFRILPDRPWPVFDASEPAKDFSKLSGIFMEDGLAVDVKIYKLTNQLGWHLETQDGSGRPVLWSKRFPTDLAAWRDFQRVVKMESMESLAGPMQSLNR